MTINENIEPDTIPIEISPEKSLYINPKLDFDQQTQLIQVLQKQSGALHGNTRMCMVFILIHVSTISTLKKMKDPLDNLNDE